MIYSNIKVWAEWNVMDASKKLAQMRALVLVVALELEKLEFQLLPKKKKRRVSHVQLTVIQGGKSPHE